MCILFEIRDRERCQGSNVLDWNVGVVRRCTGVNANFLF